MVRNGAELVSIGFDDLKVQEKVTGKQPAFANGGVGFVSGGINVFNVVNVLNVVNVVNVGNEINVVNVGNGV